LTASLFRQDQLFSYLTIYKIILRLMVYAPVFCSLPVWRIQQSAFCHWTKCNISAMRLQYAHGTYYVRTVVSYPFRISPCISTDDWNLLQHS